MLVRACGRLRVREPVRAHGHAHSLPSAWPCPCPPVHALAFRACAVVHATSSSTLMSASLPASGQPVCQSCRSPSYKRLSPLSVAHASVRGLSGKPHITPPFCIGCRRCTLSPSLLQPSTLPDPACACPSQFPAIPLPSLSLCARVESGCQHGTQQKNERGIRSSELCIS
eukprot:4092375-Pleurochrysis_carterae.AAC.1